MSTPVLEDRLRAHYRAAADEVTLADVSLHDLLNGDRVLQLTGPSTGTSTGTPAPARRSWRVGAVALGVAALVAAGLVIANRDSSSAPVPADQQLAPGEVPLLVPGWLPAGLDLRGASDQTMPEPPAYRTAVYAGAPGVLAGALLSVTVTAAPFESWEGAGVPTTVAGRRAIELSSADVAKLALDNGASGSITIAGRGFTQAELGGIAAGLGEPTTDPADGAVFEQAPAGLTLISDEAAPRSSRATELSYESDDSERMVSIGVWADAANAFEQYVVLADPGEPVEVDGKRGYRSTDDNGVVHLAWESTPGVVVHVVGTGVPADDIDRVADSLRAVSDTEWRRLLDTVSVAPQVGPQAPPTTAATPVTVPCTEQQSSPPVTVVVDCP